MVNNLIKSTILVAFLTIISKLFGFFKSVIQASYYGSSIYTDAFNMAYGVVGDILYMLTTSIAVAFVPYYISLKKDNGISKSKIQSSKIITLLSIYASIGSIVLIIFAPYIIRVVAPSYSGEQFDLTVVAFRIMTLGIAFSLTANCYQSVLNSERIYGYSSFASVINSIVLIVFIILGYAQFGIYALIVAIPVSYLIQFIVLYIKGCKFCECTLKYGLKDNSINVLMAQAMPILIGNATIEINQAVDRFLLTNVGVGAVTAVAYAGTLYQLIANTISVPLSSVVFTELSEDGAKDTLDDMRNLLKKGYEAILFICIPFSVVMFLNARDIVEIVYGHGQFTGNAITQTAEGLAFYSLCIVPIAVKQLLTKAYYALNDTKNPMKIGIMEVVTNTVFSIALSEIYGIAGVVGATALSSLLFSCVLFVHFSRKHVVIDVSVTNLFKYVIAILVCVAVSAGIKGNGYDMVFLHFIVESSVCFFIFYSALYIMKEKNICNIVNIIVCKIASRRALADGSNEN